MLFLWTFNDFNTPFVLFGATPPKSADLISIHIYGNSFVNWNFGLGSAMSVLLLLFLLVVTGAYLLPHQPEVPSCMRPGRSGSSAGS